MGLLDKKRFNYWPTTIRWETDKEQHAEVHQMKNVKGKETTEYLLLGDRKNFT